MNCIYILKDPITGIAHYIGYTTDMDRRLTEHYRNKSGTKEKRIWIARLKKQGLKPILGVLEEYETAEELPAAEEFWYGYFSLIGAELYNDPYYIGETGGRPKGFIMSETHKENIRKAALGRKMSKEAIEINRKSHSGKKLTQEHKDNISKSIKGENHPFYGKHHTEESKKKISNTLKEKAKQQ